MAKSKGRKRQRTEVVSVLPVTVDEDERLEGLNIYADELETTCATLAILAQNPEALKSKTFKALRTSVYDVQRVHATSVGTGTSLTSRISTALVDARHTDALVLLSEMRIRKQQPRLGALQRWVRECDAASIGKGKGEIVWEVLEAILRTTMDSSVSPAEALHDEKYVLTPAGIRGHESWIGGTSNGAPLWELRESGTLFTPEEQQTIISTFKPLQTTPGPQRRPPNLYPAIIYFAPEESIPLSPSPPAIAERRDVPNVPGAFLLNNLLTPHECQAIVRMGEAVGLIADQPVAGSAAGMDSVLAHNLIWLADTKFLSTLYGRVSHLVPQVISGGAVRGINARFRLYRYLPGSIYRPHIDGAWPLSALSAPFPVTSGSPPTTPYTYLYDSEPTQYSRLTMLIYLNDEFTGGCTTFFTPSTTGMGLDSWPVRPIMGSALVFPHGTTQGSLLHEGSGVIQGAKWVIRTEVMYDVERGDRGGMEVET